MSFAAYLFQIALLIRLPNSFTVISNVLAAYLIGVEVQIEWPTMGLLLASSLCFYHGGIVLNDYVDLREDRRNKVKRPLPLGLIAKPFALVLAIYLLFFGLLLLISFDGKTQLMGFAVMVCVLAYNFSSRTGLFGCVLMGLCRGLNWLFILTAVGAKEEFFHYAVLIGLYVMSLTFLSRDEHYASRRWLVGLSMASLLLASMFFLFHLDVSSDFYVVKMLVFLTGLTFLLVNYFALYQNYCSAQISKTIKFMILGMIPLDACLLFVAGYPLAAIGVFALLIPGKLLAKKMYVT